MASIARGGIQRVVVGNVAGDALRRCGRNVHARQCKPGRAVVERSRGPAHRRMAGGAVRCGECSSRNGVRRSIGRLPVR